MTYLALAYGVVWLFIFGYLYSLNRRQNTLRRAIDALKPEETAPQEEEAGNKLEDRKFISGLDAYGY
ncbi:MAG: CcmD family protein [Chloroflexi bacterium]|nr:CcmD family protein [Chloroflexota bacterium]NWJ98653.1 CcmD family protein [Chloroflexota bacterium]